MWLDAVSGYSKGEYNVKVANLLGLHTSVYWEELLNVYNRVVNKKMDDLMTNEGFFELDRQYIQHRTTLEVEEQLRIDAGLIKLGVLTHKNENELNWVKLDLEKFYALLISDELTIIKHIQKTAKLKQEDKTLAKRNSVKLNLFAILTETDTDVLEQLKLWITTMLEIKKPLSKAAVEIFERNLNNYTDSKEIKLKMLEIAISCGYNEFAWVKNQYEKYYSGKGTFIGVSQKKKTGIDPNSCF